MVWLAAKLVGRWPSGAPLTRAPEVDNPLLHDLDDFLYATDPRGRGCPFGAHIRRTNPRDLLRPTKAAESLRMTRGIGFCVEANRTAGRCLIRGCWIDLMTGKRFERSWVCATMARPAVCIS